MSQKKSEGPPATAAPGDAEEPKRPAKLPYPESLCHRCAAPPRYIETGKGSVFIMCPLMDEKYPRQPVLSCPLFKPR